MNTTESKKTVDVLMITFNAPDYVKLTLDRLLESSDEYTRIWLWQNGNHEQMLEMAREYAKDPRIHRFHHSEENLKLSAPTNWVWSEGSGQFVSKVDDDCLLPVDWISRLRTAHEVGANERFGALAASRLRPEDQVQQLIDKKIEEFGSGVKLFRNHWVQGSGYLLPRHWVERRGLLQDGESWTNYCLALAHTGAVHGFLYPLMFEDHMDDPRSENTLLHTDADLEWRAPLSLFRSKIVTLDDWEERMRKSALELQKAPIDLRYYEGWRVKLQHLRHKIEMLVRP